MLAAHAELVEGIGDGKFDAIAGVATAGVTISSPLAIMLKKPVMYVRKHEEARGLRLVEGTSKHGSRVLLIDDLVSTGTSMVSAIDALRREGYEVTDAAVLVDRLEGGKAKLEGVGVRLRSFTSIGDMLQALQAMKPAKKDQVGTILKHTEIRGDTQERHRK